MKYCCEQMRFHINEREKIIGYIPRTRSIGINISDSTMQLINFCPWCGTKLPKSLEQEMGDILIDTLGLDDIDDDPHMPEEFKTDEWWKKRGL